MKMLTDRRRIDAAVAMHDNPGIGRCILHGIEKVLAQLHVVVDHHDPIDIRLLEVFAEHVAATRSGNEIAERDHAVSVAGAERQIGDTGHRRQQDMVEQRHTSDAQRHLGGSLVGCAQICVPMN